MKATGGMKLDEPAIDLAIAVAIASSYKEREVSASDCFVGEIGLTGEIRRVNQIEDRIKEAEKIGFKRMFLPKHNLKRGQQIANSIELVGVSSIDEALRLLFPRK